MCANLRYWGTADYRDAATEESVVFTLFSYKDSAAADASFVAAREQVHQGTVAEVSPPPVGRPAVAGRIVDGGTGHGTQLFIQVGSVIAGVAYGQNSPENSGQQQLQRLSQSFVARIEAAERGVGIATPSTAAPTAARPVCLSLATTTTHVTGTISGTRQARIEVTIDSRSVGGEHNGPTFSAPLPTGSYLVEIVAFIANKMAGSLLLYLGPDPRQARICLESDGTTITKLTGSYLVNGQAQSLGLSTDAPPAAEQPPGPDGIVTIPLSQPRIAADGGEADIIKRKADGTDELSGTLYFDTAKPS